MKKILLLTIPIFLLTLGSSFGQNIIINANAFANDDQWETKIEAITNATVDVVTLDPTNIGNADQIYILVPNTPFSSTVTDALTEALDDGKRIVLVGEFSTFFDPQIDNLNALAAAIGAESSFEKARSSGAPGCTEIVVTVNQHPLTANVSSPLTASISTAALIMGTAAISLIKADFFSVLKDIAIVEQVGNGQVVFYGDTNILGGGCNPNTSAQNFISNLVNVPVPIVLAPTVEDLPAFSSAFKVLFALSMLVLMGGLIYRVF